jgi:uncharacterized protein (DUF2147 family)
MRVRPIRLCTALLLLAAPLAEPALAGDPTGIWLTEKGDARLSIAHCGQAICASIVWIKDPKDPVTGKPATDEQNPDPRLRSRPLIGVHITSDMRPSGTPDQWIGHFYNPDDGKTYDGRLTLVNATTMRAHGCVLMLCSGEHWTRVK